MEYSAILLNKLFSYCYFVMKLFSNIIKSKKLINLIRDCDVVSLQTELQVN